MDWIWNLIVNNWDTIAGFIVGIGIVAAIIKQLVELLKQVAELLLSVANALEKDGISKAELEVIKKEAQDVVLAAKNIFSVFKKK